MKEEYIVISKTAIQKRIEELEKVEQELIKSGHTFAVTRGKIDELISLLYQSTPLIPEIKKAFDAGVTSVILKIDNEEDNTVGYSKGFITKKTGESVELYPREQIKQDYITNLKIDI